MDNGVIFNLHTIVKHFLPDYVSIVCGIGAHYVQQLLNVNGLELVEITGHVPLFHESCNFWVALPVEKC